MIKPLLSIGDLLRASWDQFMRDWTDTLEVSIWFLVPPLLLIAAYLIGRPLSSSLSAILMVVAALAGVILTIRISIRLTQFVLAKSRDPKAKAPSLAVPWALFFSYLWLSVLQSLATLGGALVLVLPGIWLAIGLLFGRLFLLEDGIKGSQALSASMALVKGRWWPTFWRVVIPGAVFLILTTLVVELLSSVIGLLAGPERVALLSDLNTSGDFSHLLAGTTYQYFMQSLGEVLFLPLFLAWQVKLFHSLKDTK